MTLLDARVILVLSALSIGCGGTLQPSANADNSKFREMCEGRIVETTGALGAHSAIFVRELDIGPNPKSLLWARDRVISDIEWRTATDQWREAFAKTLTNTLPPSVKTQVSIVDEERFPKQGLLVTARLIRLDVEAVPAWGYFSVWVVDLATGNEQFYGRLEVPSPVMLGGSDQWSHAGQFTAMALANLLEPLLSKGSFVGMRITSKQAPEDSSSVARADEEAYWSERAAEAEASGKPAAAAQWRMRARR